jgi:hypothetical protein
MLAVVLVSLLVLAVCRPVVAQDATDAGDEAERGVRERVVFALSGYHARIDRAHLDEIASSERVEALLRELVGEAQLRPSLRLRAVEALGHFGDDDSAALLEAIIEEPSEALELPGARHADLFQHQAMLSFARIRPEQAAASLAPFLAHDDLQLQMTAIEALGRFGGREGRERLEQARPEITGAAALRRLERFTADGGPP